METSGRQVPAKLGSLHYRPQMLPHEILSLWIGGSQWFVKFRKDLFRSHWIVGQTQRWAMSS